MGLDAGTDREWLLYWTARGRPVPRRRVPVLAGWADLDQREADAGITARHPILIDLRLRDELLAFYAAQGLRQVVHAHAADVLRAEVATEAVLTDFDYPADYQRLVRT